MNATQARQGIILFAHGSRDPLWRKPVEAVAARVRQLDPQAQVQCAYLELMEPDLITCASGLAAGGVQSITVIPMFLGVGKHAREDLPQLIQTLRLKHPALHFSLQPAIGEDDRVVQLIAEIALGRA